MVSVCGGRGLGREYYVYVFPAVDRYLTFDAFWNRKENARDKRLAIVELLEDGDLLSKTRTADVLGLELTSLQRCFRRHPSLTKLMAG